MKYLSCLSLLLSSSVLLSFSCYVAADDSANNTAAVEKPLSVGIGTYASLLDFDDSSSDVEFSGIAITVGYVISDQFMLRGTYFSLEDDESSENESSGIDLLAYLGTGLASHGFKAYVGGGVFKDEIEKSGFGSENFSGLQLSGGIGYNWDAVSLDLVLGIRDPSDYEDDLNGSVDITAISSSLLLSARF